MAGARIHSNSWGGESNAYTSNAQEIDSFVHTHPDLLVLFAGGNDGDKGPGSIGEPATCKNCLAVGASQVCVCVCMYVCVCAYVGIYIYIYIYIHA